MPVAKVSVSRFRRWMWLGLTPSRMNGGGVNADLGAFGIVSRKRDDEGCGRGEGWHPPTYVPYILECRFNNMWITRNS